jgi:hypothetical protein
MFQTILAVAAFAGLVAITAAAHAMGTCITGG